MGEAGLQVFRPIRVMMLEFSCFLENFLWPNFGTETASYAHVMCIIIMINEKFRESVSCLNPSLAMCLTMITFFFTSP